MPLHPEAVAARARRAAENMPPRYTQTLAEARATDLAEIQAGSGVKEPVGSVRDVRISGRDAAELVIRVYEPANDVAGSGTWPALLYFFGGGWVLGNLETGDGICRSMTNAIGCVTVSVGYRLAPEFPFPAAVEDCYAGLEWLADNAADLNVDPQRIAVGGDSAGGNLAAAISLLARDAEGPSIRHQLLVYPAADYLADTPSMRENDDPLLFNRRSAAWYWGHYLRNAEDGENPLASPLRALSLAGLPPATVITAEFDPLRDEGEQYAKRLCESGVRVEARRFDGMPHGFFAMPGYYAAGRQAQEYAACRLAAAFAGGA